MEIGSNRNNEENTINSEEKKNTPTSDHEKKDSLNPEVNKKVSPPPEAANQASIIPINKNEPQNFVNDILKYKLKLQHNKKEILTKKRWFVFGFIAGLVLSLIAFFFIYATVFFIQNTVLYH